MRWLVVLALVWSVMTLGTASAQTVKPIPGAQPESPSVWRYALMANPPIPVGTEVRLEASSQGMVINWEEEKGLGGTIVHRDVIQGVVLEVYPYVSNKGEDPNTRSPRDGERAVLKGYLDLRDARGEPAWGGDGVADRISFAQFRNWTSEESELLDFVEEYVQTLKDEGLFMLRYAADMPPDRYLMNGRPVEPGPYGRTYKVPKEGGKLSAWYAPEHREWMPADGVRWTVEVKPGDYVRGTERIYVAPVSEWLRSDPWGLNWILDDQYPQWQSARVGYIPYGLEKLAGNLHSVKNNGAKAMLPRLGFRPNSVPFSGGYPEKTTSFVWWGNSSVKVPLPVDRWENVDEFELGGKVFKVVTGSYDSPVVIPVEGEVKDPRGVWSFKWGDTAIFVPQDVQYTYRIDWSKVTAIRVNKSGDGVIIQKAVWKEEK